MHNKIRFRFSNFQTSEPILLIPNHKPTTLSPHYPMTMLSIGRSPVADWGERFADGLPGTSG